MSPIQLKFNSFNPIQQQTNSVNNIVTRLHECIQREKTERTTRFAFIALCFMLINAVLDFLRSMPVSGTLILAMAIVTALIIIFSAVGHKKFIVPVIIATINIFLLSVSFVEGLRSGTHMQILALLFTLGYLTADKSVTKLESGIYFFTTACCFCACIFFGSQTNMWQHISDALYNQMYIFNCVSAVLVCVVFAGIHVHSEKRFRFAYLEQKLKAEILQTTINEQNKHLQEIAYTSSHVVRRPLANILALTKILNTELNRNLNVTDIINHLDVSSKCLDEAIKEIVSKTKTDNENPEAFLIKI